MPPRIGKTAPSIDLADHRATYNVTLYKSTGTKSPTAARGRVSYEFTGSACDGYSQVFRQVTQLQPAEGTTRLSDMRSATFEDPEGKNFSFDVKSTLDDNPPESSMATPARKTISSPFISPSRPPRRSTSGTTCCFRPRT